MVSIGKVFQGIEGPVGGSTSSGSTKTTGKAISSVTGNKETDSKDGTTEVTDTETGQTSGTNTNHNQSTTIANEFQNNAAVAKLLDPNAPLTGFSVAGQGAGLDRSQAYKDPIAAQRSFAEALNPSQFANSLPASNSMGQTPINSQQGANNAWGSVGGSSGGSGGTTSTGSRPQIIQVSHDHHDHHDHDHHDHNHEPGTGVVVADTSNNTLAPANDPHPDKDSEVAQTSSYANTA